MQRDQADALRARGLRAVTVNALSGQPARDEADELLGSGHQWGPGLVLAAEGGRLTVLFDEYGYRELVAKVVVGSHLLGSAGDD